MGCTMAGALLFVVSPGARHVSPGARHALWTRLSQVYGNWIGQHVQTDIKESQQIITTQARQTIKASNLKRVRRSICMYVYIYIYIYICVYTYACMYIYIYIHTSMKGRGRRVSEASGTQLVGVATTVLGYYLFVMFVFYAYSWLYHYVFIC